MAKLKVNPPFGGHKTSPTNLGLGIWWALGLVLGVALFILVRSFITCYSLTSLPGIPPASCSGPQTSVVVNPQGTPVKVVVTPTASAPLADLPVLWDGASRVNILLLGLDYRDVSDALYAATQGPPHTDSMWLVTIDPLTKTAGGVSIPRDLWVDIPGFGYGKINTAYTFGEAYKLPGGGAALAMKTVSEFMGVPIQYYAWIEFSAFIKAVDQIGGVEVCVPAPIDVGLYDVKGTDHLNAGCQILDGIDALGYSRDRYTQLGDVDRSGRQKQVLLAMLDKIESPKNWATLAPQIPGLYQDLSTGIHTNMNLPDAIKLAALARTIPTSQVDMKVIDYTMMTDAVAPDGTDILRPFTDKIGVLRDEIFGGELSPEATGDLTSKIQAEGARVVVINGTGTAGLAAKTKDYLTSQGLNVIAAANTTDYPDQYLAPFPNRTILILHSGKPYAAQYLINLMKLTSSSQVIVDFNPSAPDDIVVGLGYDWAAKNPMP